MEDHLPVLRVFLLGSFRLELVQPDGTTRVIDDFEAVLGRGLSATLFKLLLCQPERRVKRDLLVRAMWPGQTSVSVRKSLDVTKSQLSRTLAQLCGRPLLPRVTGDPPLYAIASQSLLWTDVDACEEVIRQARATRDSVASLAHWECAYSFMQRGEWLADDTTAYWYTSPLVQDRLTRLTKQRVQGVLRIADLSLECGNISRALEVLTQACEADAAHEDLAFHLMNALARLSRYPEALARYTQLEAALEARGAVPRTETKQLALWLRASASTKRWSPAEIGVSGSAQDQKTDEMGRQAILLPAIEYARPIDWGEAPQVKAFYGREQELTELRQEIVNEQAHLVAIIGMAGVGKTSLAVALIEQIHATFHTVIWRSLQNALPFHMFLQQCIETLSDQQQTDLPERLDDQISLLLSYLRTDRCLLVLDNLESILQGGKRAGEYREGYESYGRLITRIAESKHQGCLLLTSREKPREVALLEDTSSPVRAFCLRGLLPDDGIQILKDKGVQGETQALSTLISLYAGNPLALKLISQYIVEVFHANIAAFLHEGEVISHDIQEV